MRPSPERHCPCASKTVRPSGNFGVTSDARNCDHARSVTKGRPLTDEPKYISTCWIAEVGAAHPSARAAGADAAMAARNAAAAVPRATDRDLLALPPIQASQLDSPRST